MKRRAILAVAALCGFAALTGCSSSGSETPNAYAAKTDIPTAAAMDPAIVEAANKEGSLLVYGEANEASMKPVLAAFQDQYPGIKTSYISLGGTESFQRYLNEKATGGKTADVIVSLQGANFLDLVKRGDIQDFTPPAAAPLPDFAKLAPGVFAMELNPVMALINTTLLPESEQPDSLEALARMSGDPKLAGKIVTYDGTTEFGYTVNHAYIAKAGEAGWKILDQLGPNTKVEASAGPMFNKLLQGEYTMSYFQSGATRPLLTGATAKVLNYRFFKDGTPFMPRGAGATTGGKSPNAAKVFVNFLIDKAGQTAGCTGGFAPYLDGVDCPVNLAKVTEQLGAENINIATWDEALINDSPAFKNRWKEAFGR
ncbi:ABC transporter substrate-binding protein [Paenarthrobacter sp. YJN-5]|uniref:ABC transporter substrate-binding protein n=1 Tax=Paenarthrobacter sp. YJN-5 TaxID=2735316 RepID=UPI001D0C15BF|nr:ABC transporter substrate-binding protein [Paenarthrobacter sp. YJN-5]